MAEVARWKPNTPAAFYPGRWGWLRDRRFLVHVAPTPFLVVIAVGCLSVALRSGVRDWAEIVMPLVPLALAGGLVWEAAEARPHRRFRRLIRNRRNAVVHPVRLLLLRDGVAYGGDDGVVRFENGVLRYGGLATRFRLRAVDAWLLPDAFVEDPAVRPSFEGAAYGNLMTEEAWAFDLAAYPGVQVRFMPVDVPGRPSMCGPLFRWLLDAAPAQGEAVFPPLDPKPGYAAPKLLARRNAESS